MGKQASEVDADGFDDAQQPACGCRQHGRCDQKRGTLSCLLIGFFKHCHDLFDLMLRTQNRGDDDQGIGTEDSASCSCVEGNPCISPYNCKNWEKRFEIAKQARKR